MLEACEAGCWKEALRRWRRREKGLAAVVPATTLGRCAVACRRPLRPQRLLAAPHPTYGFMADFRAESWPVRHAPRG